MKRMLFLLTLALGLAMPVAAEDAKPAEKGGASALIIDALRGLSALLPKPDVPVEETKSVSTIGVRGSESTATLITPYWKDDRSNDPAFAAQLTAYAAAQTLLEQHRWEEAQQAMSAFLAAHPASDLVPNARFGEALAQAGAGRGKEAAAQFAKFAQDFPAHPLRARAQELASALASAN